MREYWTQVEGAENGYMVSNLGRVKGIRKPIMGQHDNGIGYLQCKIKMNDGAARWLKVHRMVAAAFVPNPEGKPEVNHIDGNKQNNRADNLEWVSHKDNVKHAYTAGLHGYKTKASGTEKLTPEQIIEIRESSKSQKELAAIYGVAQPSISLIKSRKIYAWVK